MCDVIVKILLNTSSGRLYVNIPKNKGFEKHKYVKLIPYVNNDN